MSFKNCKTHIFPKKILAQSQPEHVLKMFLNFEEISGSVSYKKVSYKKKKCMPNAMWDGSENESNLLSQISIFSSFSYALETIE